MSQWDSFETWSGCQLEPCFTFFQLLYTENTPKPERNRMPSMLARAQTSHEQEHTEAGLLFQMFLTNFKSFK